MVFFNAGCFVPDKESKTSQAGLTRTKQFRSDSPPEAMTDDTAELLMFGQSLRPDKRASSRLLSYVSIGEDAGRRVAQQHLGDTPDIPVNRL